MPPFCNSTISGAPQAIRFGSLMMVSRRSSSVSWRNSTKAGRKLCSVVTPVLYSWESLFRYFLRGVWGAAVCHSIVLFHSENNEGSLKISTVNALPATSILLNIIELSEARHRPIDIEGIFPCVALPTRLIIGKLFVRLFLLFLKKI